MIDPLSGAALAGGLGAITGSLVGKSLADAWAENITGGYDPFNPSSTDPGISIGIGTKTTLTPAISGDTSNTISDSSEVDPVDAWHDYIEQQDGKVDSTTGGIVSGSTGSTMVFALVEDDIGKVSAAAPIAVPLDEAYVAISKALGVAMKVSEINPVLGSKLGGALVAAGCVYDKSKGLVTAWWDGTKTLFPKKAVEAVSDALEEEGIPTGGSGSEGYVSDLDISPATMPIPAGGQIDLLDGTGNPSQTMTFLVPTYKDLGKHTTSIVVGDYSYHEVAYLISHYASGQVTTLRAACSLSVTYEGKTVFYGVVGGSFRGTVASMEGVPSGEGLNAEIYGKIAWTFKYGTRVGYPEGTARADSTAYTPDTLPSAGGVATSATTTEPVVPINIPVNPTDTIGDSTDPTTGTTTPEQQKTLPTPPVPLPIPETRPSRPEIPLRDPTTMDPEFVDQIVEELATTVDPQPPQSDGIIPVPLLPGIDIEIPGGGTQRIWPSIIPSSGPGFIHVYNPTPEEFVSFGTWLWVTYADATIEKILNNPFDGVIGAHELYATPDTSGRDNMRSAFLTCPTSADLVPNRYTEIDCGTVIVPEFYGNYLDYSPHSQAYIYLPFIGINEVSIDDIVGHAVNIIYRVDSYSGACIAMIFVAKNNYQNLCYQFAGNCSVDVPMAGGSQAAIKAGMMQAEAYARAAMIQAGASALGGIGSALMGSLGGVLASIGGIASSFANARAGMEAARVANKSSVQHSGQFGASHGAMGQKKPFIIIRNPIQVKVTNYNEDYGFPAHKRVIIGGCEGYLRVREVNVISAHATDEEKRAIEAALKNGVYVS